MKCETAKQLGKRWVENLSFVKTLINFSNYYTVFKVFLRKLNGVNFN